MKTMMKVAMPTQHHGVSFKLIPIDLNSPYLECRFNIAEKILVVISKEKYSAMQMLIKLDDNGNPLMKPGKGGKQMGVSPYQQERKFVESFYDYGVTQRSEVETLVKFLTGEEHDLSEYYVELPPSNETETETADQTPKILNKDGE